MVTLFSKLEERSASRKHQASSTETPRLSASHAVKAIEEILPLLVQGFQPLEAQDPDPEKATQCKRQGDKAFSDKDFPGAEQVYTNALRHDTSNHLLWANRSAARLRQGKNAEALQDARTSRQINPKYLKASPPLILWPLFPSNFLH